MVIPNGEDAAAASEAGGLESLTGEGEYGRDPEDYCSQTVICDRVNSTQK